jgi:hypothetical protein
MSPHGSWTFRIGLAAAAAALFIVLAGYLRSVERAVTASSGISDQLDAGRLRPAAEVARSIAALKLVTIEIETTARAERASESWRGDVKASVTAPARLLFGTDLSELHAVAFSPVTRAYLVRVPPPTRVATEVDAAQENAEVEVGWARTRSIAGEYWLGQARKGLYDEARRLALPPEQARQVREMTRRQVRAMVERIVGAGTPVKVVFADE